MEYGEVRRITSMDAAQRVWGFTRISIILSELASMGTTLTSTTTGLSGS